jgi:hypothetical protein
MTGKIMAVMALSTATVLASVAGAEADAGAHAHKQQVSEKQYNILYNQCKYANTPKRRKACRKHVRHTYRIGRYDPDLDCRTYVGVTVCGELKLSRSERECVADSVSKGLTRRRSEVECYVYW